MGIPAPVNSGTLSWACIVPALQAAAGASARPARAPDIGNKLSTAEADRKTTALFIATPFRHPHRSVNGSAPSSGLRVNRPVGSTANDRLNPLLRPRVSLRGRWATVEGDPARGR